MASTAASAYGTYNPVALQPYPIETELAKLSGLDATGAKILGDQYWLERQAHENLYGQELQAQHQQYQQQLENQLYEQNVKALGELTKPGVAQLVATSPYYQRVLGGADPSAVANMIQMSNDAAAAQNLAHVGSALSGYASGGYITNLPTDPTHGQYSFIGTPAEIAGKYRLAAAGVAAAAANAAKPWSMNVQGPVSGAGAGISMTGPMDPRNPQASTDYARQLQAYLENQAQQGQVPPTTLPAAPLVPKKIPMTPGTNLQPSARPPGAATPSTVSPKISILPPQAPEYQPAQVDAMKYVEGLKATNPDAYKILAQPGNVIPLMPMPNGTIAIIGNDGKPYGFPTNVRVKPRQQ